MPGTKSNFFLITSSLLVVLALSLVYLYRNAEKIIHPLLIPPDYFWLDLSENIYEKTGVLEIAGRKFEVPVAFVDGRFIDGRIKDTALFTYILPEFKSKLEFSSQAKRQKLLEEGYYGGMLLEEASIRPPVSHSVEIRKQKSIAGDYKKIPDQYGLESYNIYYGRPDSRYLYSTMHVEKDVRGNIIGRIECDVKGRSSVVIYPRCNHRFVDKKLLYSVSYDKNRYFHDWKSQKRAAINFIDNLEILNSEITASNKEDTQ